MISNYSHQSNRLWYVIRLQPYSVNVWSDYDSVAFGISSFTCRGSFFNRSKILRCEVLSAGLDKCNVTRYREKVSTQRQWYVDHPNVLLSSCRHDHHHHRHAKLFTIPRSTALVHSDSFQPLDFGLAVDQIDQYFFSQIPYTIFEVHRFSLRLPFPLSCNFTRYWIKQTNLHPKDLESYVRSSKKSMHKTYKLAGKATYPGGKNASYHVRRHFRNDHVYTCLLRSSWIRAIWDPVWSSFAIWIDAK